MDVEEKETAFMSCLHVCIIFNMIKIRAQGSGETKCKKN